MRNRHLLFGGTLLALVAATPAAPASAQTMTPMPTWSTTPRQFETYYTEYRLATRDADDRVRTEGVGARLMWQLPAPDDATTLRSRTSVGLSAAYSRQNIGPMLSTQYVAAESEVELLPSAMFGRVSPFVGLGVGALRTHSTIAATKLTPKRDREIASFVLAPSVGTRLELGRGLGIRADVRDLITFHEGTRHNPAFGVGLSLTF